MVLIHLTRESWHEILVSLARMCDTGERILKCLAQNGKPPWFQSGEENVVEFNNDNPTTYNKNATRKARLTIVMPSSKGKKIHQKGQLRYELDQWPSRCKAASYANNSTLEFQGGEIRHK
jgi:hypothetical protein